jgi:hypothetical protein
MTVRKPTCWCEGPGGRVEVDEAEMHLHRYQSASTFSVILAMKDIEQNGGSIAAWLNEKPTLKITGSNDGQGSGTLLIEGEADIAEPNWKAQTIRLDGRDATAKLLDATTDPQKHQFKNKSAVDIVRELAGEKGLSVETDGGSGGGGGTGGGGSGGGGGPGSGGAASRAGRKHVGQDFDFLTGQESYWNVIRNLAEKEGKVAWVDPTSKTLHFKDVRSSGNSGKVEIKYTPPQGGPPEGNFVELTTSVNYAAKSPSVDVHSWHSREKKDNSNQGGQGGGGGEQDELGNWYRYEYPGLTQEQSKQIGEAKKAEHGRHFMQLRFTGPGDVSVNPQMTCVLSGTRTIFDDTYDIDSVRFYFSGEADQFTMNIEAKTKAS